ncbi:MAG: hypothetical protein EA425_05715 [Puniceicoccaceae bacterium]|nr:MAG: hypothetical protein EA425_05715 [Puniceicoccaceae bacterium]
MTPILLRCGLGLLLGAVAGGLLGAVGQCTTGACPLTATWWRGALFGGIMGLLIALSLERT